MAHERLLTAIEDDPDNDWLQLALVDVYMEVLDFHAANDVIETLRRKKVDDPRVQGQLPRVLMGIGDREAALAHARALAETSTGTRGICALLGLVEMLQQAGRLEEARAILATLDRTDPQTNMRCFFAEGKVLLQEKDWEGSAERLRQFIELREPLPDEPSMPTVPDAWFQIAKALDRMGDYDQAWEAARSGHAPYEDWDNGQHMVADLDQIRTFMTRETLSELAHADMDLQWSPLFIVGMPRSGTTLLEQILSMHPDVSNGGEMSISLRMIVEAQQLTDSYLPWPKSVVDLRVDDVNQLGRLYMDAVRPFAGTTRIVSNKALALQAQLGFLSLAVPNARAIMLYRHPLDNAVSCFTNNLVAVGHRYTSNMTTFGKVWVARRKLQEFWLEQLDIPMMELHYESMVQHQDDETRRLLAFLDVDWNPKCLEFHESTNMARTISFDQVNRKMYSTSDGRWKHYEKYLGPVIDEVGDYL